MKRTGKKMFFIVVAFILIFTTLSFTGISTKYGDKTTVFIKGASNIRWGIDIRGGVDVTFTPGDNVDPTDVQLNAASEVMRQRLVSLNITDYEVYTDTNTNRIIVRFPWKEGEENFDPQKAINELGDTAILTFKDGTTNETVLEGKNVQEAKALYGPSKQGGANEYYVSLKLDPTGTTAFADATTKLAGKGTISIWMDDIMISNPNVNDAITTGEAVISGGEGGFKREDAEALANKINAGALPFKLQTETYSTISPTLGAGARDTMLIAGVIAFVIICMYIISYYRVPGMVASIALLGQVGGTIAIISGFFDGINSFTLTIPGIAGIILSLGIGVDANIITAERIKEEVNSGRSIDGSIEQGFKRAFAAIFDGNVTVILIAIILMGAFGAPNSIWSQLFTPLFFWAPPSTQGAIFSFGFTLMIGVILNFVFGVTASRLMLKSLSKYKSFRNPKLYGGNK